jgi:HAD superfamily hydrolase (TIGR01509 family)
VTVQPGAVIFDCDGVLVDSEGLMNREFRTMLGEIGLSYTAEETTRTFMGRSMTSCMRIVESRLGRAVPDDFLQQLDRRAYAVFERDLRPVAGVEAVLDALDRAGTPYAVASSGSHEKMQTTLGITGLYARLEGRITSATEVAHGKPAPDVFLLAAERLRVQADHCVVVEDSLLGIEAALAAGMRVIGFAAMIPADDMHNAGATWVVDSMDAVRTLIAAE